MHDKVNGDFFPWMYLPASSIENINLFDEEIILYEVME